MGNTTYDVRHVKVVPMGYLSELEATLNDGYELLTVNTMTDNTIVYTMVRVRENQ